MAGRHREATLPPVRSRLPSSSAPGGPFGGERERGERDKSGNREREREGDRGYSREGYSKEKERDRFRDWDADRLPPRDRLRDRERERERERERDRERDREKGKDRGGGGGVGGERDAGGGKMRRYGNVNNEGDRLQSPPNLRPSSGTSSATVAPPRSSHSLSPSSDNVVDRLDRDVSNVVKEGRNSGLASIQGTRQGGKDLQVGKYSEREPGELPSGARLEDTAWSEEILGIYRSKGSWHPKPQGLELDMVGTGSPRPKKRKYSPIVWDYDEKQVRPKVSSGPTIPAGQLSVSRFSTPQPSQSVAQVSARNRLLSSSPTPGSLPSPVQPSSADRLTPPDIFGNHPARVISSSNSESPSSPSLGDSRVPQFFLENNSEKETMEVQKPIMAVSPESDGAPEPGQLLPDTPKLEDEEDVPVPITIAASRWAEEETHTPEKSKSPRVHPGKNRKLRSSSLESEEGRISAGQGGDHMASGPSTSPEPGEYIREKSDAGRTKEKGNDSDGSVGQGSGAKDRSAGNSMEDEEYEQELNKRELMELDEEDNDEDDGEEQRPELVDFEGLPPTPTGPLLRAIDMLQGCRSVDEFEKLNKIDEGTYGVVYRARNKKNGEIIALKKVKMEKEKEGFPMTSLREINVLLSIHHPSIVDVKEVVVGSNIDSIFMVMEYMEHDLKGLMETMKQPFSQSEVKCLMKQLFEGVKYLHDNWVLHRDLKTSNLLLNNRGELKICDFGLARQYGSPLKAYSHMVVTLWYRAPELLLGSKLYSTAIDMWSLGCIMAEFLAKEPLFNGKSEIDQIDKIFKTLGTPTEKIWPDFVNLPSPKCNFVRQPYNRLREKFPPTAFAGRPPLSESGFDLLNRLLTYDPQKRITAEDALKHEWFDEVPLPKSKEFMPTFPARSEHDRRMRRLMKSPDPLEEQRKRELRGELGAGGLFG